MSTIENYFLPVDCSGEMERIEIRLPRKMGVLAKLHIRNIAKEFSEYKQPIKISVPTKKVSRGRKSKSVLDSRLTEETDQENNKPGVDINKINTIGKWLFGVSNYFGNIKVSNPNGTIAYIEYPKSSPQIVHDLFAKIKQKYQK